jgi:site-specific recombinase XerD
MTTTKNYASGSLYSACGQRKYLTSAERHRFISAAMRCPRLELRTFCLVLAYTGCRISEALALTADSVEMNEQFIAVRSLKKRSRKIVIRELPIPQVCVRLLRRVHGLDGGASSRRLWTWSRSRAWQLVKSVMSQASIVKGVHATPKGLRHGFGLHAIQCGVPLNLVQRWLGHARMETTSIYLQAIGAEERAIASRMWARPQTRRRAAYAAV